MGTDVYPGSYISGSCKDLHHLPLGKGQTQGCPQRLARTSSPVQMG